jgi:hypothetical protein
MNTICIYDYITKPIFCKCGCRIIPIQGPKITWHFRHIGICNEKKILNNSNKSYTSHTSHTSHTLYIKQNGAGSGKTWNIINMIHRQDFLRFKRFIYVSKQHSARAIIKDEFLSQYNEGLLNITNMKFRDIGKKYIIDYTNSQGDECCIIISTIDAFMYSIGDKTVQTYDLFEGIVQSIIDNSIENTIQFAGLTTQLSETLYISDETQDLKEIYGMALLKIIKETNMTVYVVGDQLQSISNETNAFTYLKNSNCDSKCDESKYIEPAINICRRFSHPILIDFVNFMIPFSKYNLPKITSYQRDNRVRDNRVRDNRDSNPLTVLFEKGSMNEQIDEIMIYYKKEVENGLLPKDFLIVTPFVSNNPMISCLNTAINQFWIEKNGAETYTTYSVFHKSEIGTSINLDESKETTRIVSIHSAKGDGRPCVFVVGLHETSLKIFSGLKDTLIYDSLLHVAITRMKQKLYITCNENDEIGQRIKNFLLKNDMPYITQSLFIDPKINIKNILPACGEKINEIISLDYKPINEDKEINQMNHIHAGYYSIRYGLMFQQVCKKLKDQQFDRMSHIKVIREIALNSPIVICTSWKEYNTRLKMNTGTEENEYNDRDISIPLLNIRGYSIHFNTIYSNIEIIRNTSGNHLSCLQSIIFYYMTQVTSRGRYTNMNILELYKIMHQYDKVDYVDSHDEYMKELDKICEPLLQYKMSWNPNVSIEYGNDIILKTQIDLIGYNNDTVILCYFKPEYELSRMNYNELKIKSFIDSYLVSKSENLKYKGKKIVICLMSYHKQYFIEYDVKLFESLRIILKDTLYDYFSIKNKEVVQYKGNNIRPTVSYIHECIGGSLEDLNKGLREILELY